MELKEAEKKVLVENTINEFKIIQDSVLNTILWKLRKFNNKGKEFCDILFNLNNEFKIETSHKSMKLLVNKIIDLLYTNRSGIKKQKISQ